MDAQVEDAVAVLDAAGVRRVAVLAWSAGGPVESPWPRVTRSGFPALSFTARTRLVAAPDYPCGQPPEVVQSLRLLVLAEWGLGSRLLANVVVSETDPGFATWFTGYLRLVSPAEVAADLLWAVAESDVRVLLPVIGVPVLVIHRRDDCKVDYRAEATWPSICRAPGWSFWKASITCPIGGTPRRSPTPFTGFVQRGSGAPAVAGLLEPQRMATYCGWLPKACVTARSRPSLA